MIFDPTAYWPRGPVSNLLVVARHPDADVARKAWQEWEALGIFEDATWADLRIFPAVAHRLPSLGIKSPLVPRFAGVRKYMWARMQKMLTETRPIFVALTEAGAHPVVTKGGARIAVDPAQVSERYSEDIDILIPPAEWAKAVDILLDLGLSNPVWDRQRLLTRMREERHSVSLSGPKVGIDLHQSALRLNRCIGDDDALLARAAACRLVGVPVRAPSASDRLVMALGHGLLDAPGRPADWVLDGIAAIGAPDFDWATAAAEIRERGLAAYATVGLGYLAEVLNVGVPGDLRRSFEATVRVLDAEEFASQYESAGVRSPRGSIVRLMAACQRADDVLRRRPMEPGSFVADGGWRRVARGGDGAGIAVPSGLDPGKMAWLDLRLPKRRFPALITTRYTLQAPEGIVAEMAPGSRWRRRPKTLSFAVPASYLVMHSVTELRVHASFTAGAWSTPRRAASIQYRWRQ